MCYHDQAAQPGELTWRPPGSLSCGALFICVTVSDVAYDSDVWIVAMSERDSHVIYRNQPLGCYHAWPDRDLLEE
jgi:hypothetical protein